MTTVGSAEGAVDVYRHSESFSSSSHDIHSEEDDDYDTHSVSTSRGHSFESRHSILSMSRSRSGSQNGHQSLIQSRSPSRCSSPTDSRSFIDSSSGSSGTSSTESTDTDPEEYLPFPGFVPVALHCLEQTSVPRNWCLTMITNPWFERISMMIILLNCITLGMYQPCVDEACTSSRCKTLQLFDHLIFVFFAVEMIIKIVAMGLVGKTTYLAETWNRLDMFIVIAGTLEYCLDVGSINLSAIRTIRVLRPLRAINRIPSMRILVMLLLDTLPMLGNVLLLCFFVFFIFGIVGVQLWAGLLRQRCFMEQFPPDIKLPGPVSSYYQRHAAEKDYICSVEKDNGIHGCDNLPHYQHQGMTCNASAVPQSNNTPTNTSCVNWNQYYKICRAGDKNPFRGAISFDNIGLAWVAIFLVISLEGWTDIMYYIQDAHSFWDWIYFVLLIVVGSFFMINLCLVVIATQFSETKKRELERMRLERARFQSTSTLASTSASEQPLSCYTEMVKYLAHLGRRARRRFLQWYKQMRRKHGKEDLPRSISLRRKRQKPPWQPGQSTLKRQNLPWQPEQSSLKRQGSSHDVSNNNNFDSMTFNPISCVHTSQTPEHSGMWSPNETCAAPCASPEVSVIDPTSSPTRPGLLKVPSSVCSPDNSSVSDCPRTVENPDFTPSSRKPQSSTRQVSLQVTRQHSSASGNSKTSQLTCAELLAFTGAQGAALAASLASNYAMQRFYSSLKKGQKHSSAPVILCELDREKESHQSRSECGWTDSEGEIDDERSVRRGPLSSFFYWWKPHRAKLKGFVGHKYFQRGILTAILINTLSMGIEYHNQPKELTFAVEVFNLILTGIFGLEMLLKVLAEGVFGYISNGFNVFDGVIVILSIVELWQSSGSGLSVLRTFRLLRILKLVRFMPALRRQLVIMLRTMDNVAVFFSLLILFIFIFSILGMNLFGCKFCEKDEDGTMQCDRKNFDSLLWAIVTVFQILTQEDWNVVLFNGMEKTSHWAALYFVALMTFGNYVLFNLLVAILVEGFSTEDDKKKSSEKLTDGSESKNPEDNTSDSDSFKPTNKITNVTIYNADFKDNIEKETRMLSNPPVLAVTNICNSDTKPSELLCYPPIITHTAATPQGSPNATLEPLVRDLNNKLSNLMTLNISNSSIDSIDKSPIQSLVGTAQQSPSLSRTHSRNNVKLALPSSGIITTLPEIDHRCSQLPVPPVRRSSLSPSFLSRNGSLTCSPHLCRKGSQSSSGGSFKLRRPSSMYGWKAWQKKKCDKESFVDLNTGLGTESEEVRLTNKTIVHQNIPAVDHTHCNGGLPALSNIINFNRPVLSKQNSINSHKTLSPQNSIKSHSSHSPTDDPAESFNSQLFDNRQASISISVLSHNILSPQQSFNSHSYLSSRHNSLSGSSLKEEIKTNNLTDLSPVNPENEEHSSDKYFTGKLFWLIEPQGCLKEREDYSLFIFSPENWIRNFCAQVADHKKFDFGILFFITLNCITLAIERPNIPPESIEREVLTAANYIFTIVFGLEMVVKVIAKGLWYGEHAYLKSGWNKMDGILVSISLLDFVLSFLAAGSPKIFGILRVFRLLRSLRPLRVINRAPGLKLVVQTLLSSLRPIGNIVLICCTFFIIFGILGVQLFKGKLYYCDGPNVKNVSNKTECLADPRNEWINRKYNFDNLGQALMALFVLSSKDGWVNIMYTGLDAVDVDQQPIENYNEWRLIYFISFLLLVAFFVLNMFVGVVVENFHRCREEQEKEEKALRAEKRARKLEKKRRKMREPPYYINFSKPRLFTNNIVTSKYFDLAIAAVIGLNVVTMAMEFYMMPTELVYALKIFNYFFTAVFILEAIMKAVALGVRRYLIDKWNQLDVIIVILSVVGIFLEEMESKIIPINPTIIRVMRVLRIARVLKLLKMAKGIRALLDTVMQALPQVGNLGLLFFLLFFIFAALGVELFGRLECNDKFPCQGLGEHAHFHNFGMAFLTLFRIATGDNWNGIMKDTLRDNCDSSSDCLTNCCVSQLIAPLYFVIFVLMAQFVLVNVVVAVLMKHLEESHKQMDDDADIDVEIENELAAEAIAAQQMEILGQETYKKRSKAKTTEIIPQKPLVKVSSLPANFTFTFQEDVQLNEEGLNFPPAAITIQISEFGESKNSGNLDETCFVGAEVEEAS
ncbi:voltage-dependent T-type calcium channel subunit alpha-1G-like isoform X2 [Limulus polyphemus]|uniref:Voltage-dependent T-type calcium channel subunit alpha n=1 Tax=Limulus polyphemus TaxID=6850 RepID=A0ABM1TND7_LIMPO|nr:voltage-dependent T-type calcium channel subunit alpha-1G-like isoform X2 [Limulus polyphemus]